MSAQLSGEETARLTIRVASWPEVLEAMSSLGSALALIEWLSRGTYRDPDRDADRDADRAASDGEA